MLRFWNSEIAELSIDDEVFVATPAWKSKPSWYLVVSEDKRIPPVAQRAMSKRAGSVVAEVKGSHAIYVSQPKAVAALIDQAVKERLRADLELQEDNGIVCPCVGEASALSRAACVVR